MSAATPAGPLVLAAAFLAIGSADICGVHLSTSLHAQQGSVAVGRGSFAGRIPPQAKGPPPPAASAAGLRAPLPTGDWWSSLLGSTWGEPHYPHPLAIRAQAEGLRVCYPGADLSAAPVGIFGAMPGGPHDLILGHSAAPRFSDMRVVSWSDWFIELAFSAGDGRMNVGYGHGSPFVYATFEGGSPRVTFGSRPEIWAGSLGEAVLGVTVRGRPYGLFGPAGSRWEQPDAQTLVNRAGDRRYFSLAALPEATRETLEHFAAYAHAHVTDTRIAWSYEPAESAVVTRFMFTTKRYEPGPEGTIFALYPHQWRNTDAKLEKTPYASVRGAMRWGHGREFVTRHTFPGVLPALPLAPQADRKRLAGYLAEAAADAPPLADTYWDGKTQGRLAALIPIAGQLNDAVTEQRLLGELRRRQEDWFTAGGAPGAAADAALFAYDARWGTLIGYPASYGSDTELNDHHFHYGYFLRAAAALAEADPQWAASQSWGGMVELLIRDIACPRRDDPQFPFLRCFDPYAGHSWASGRAGFADGNNQESSSEAMNAWYGLILWGQARGDRELRDLGIFLYATEMAAIQEYWFDVHGENFPAAFPRKTLAMVWGGKGTHETWFSADPEAIHGINWLPIHGGSLYLGQYPRYVSANYAELLAEEGDGRWDMWADIVWMYRALADPAAAEADFLAGVDTLPLEGGNSKAAAYHWIEALRALGQVDRTVTADHPLYAVFRLGGRRHYVAYHRGPRALAVRFSGGFVLQADGAGFAVGTEAIPAR